MTDLQALYAGICAQPDEDTPRLALADFLDEQGGKPNQFRADVIRTHCRLEREEPWSHPWRELSARWEKLAQKVNKLEQERKLPWLAHLKGRVKGWALERGLVGHLTLFSKRFVEEGDSYFQQDPIRSVKFVKLTSMIGTVKPEVLFASPHMARIAKLDLDGSGLKDADLARLAKSPCAPGLRSLTLDGDNPFGSAAVPKLLKAMPELTELSFQGNAKFGSAHAKALAKCPELARISSLNLSLTSVGPDGVSALVSGKTAGALTVLALSPHCTDLTEWDEYSVPTYDRDRVTDLELVSAVAASKALTALQELDLGHRDIGADGVKLLVGAAKALPALRRLHLEDCSLTFAAVEALAGSALGGRLLYLNLRDNENLLKHRTKLKKMFPSAHVEEPYDYGA
jgi:uncharacterized protein (TIGR02996 family)